MNGIVFAAAITCVVATVLPGQQPKPPVHDHLIIDVDTGVDDALALVLAFSLNTTVDLITVVRGNTDLETAFGNTLRVLELCGRTQIPVYQGSDGPIGGRYVPSDGYFGPDGFGNVSSCYPLPNTKMERSQHAALKMIDMVKREPQKYTLILLGPVTNAAVAITVDPRFTSYLKAIFILGGNIAGRGNVLPGSEFNFYFDPEGADIVLAKADCPVTIIPWETVVDTLLPWDKYDTLAAIPTKKGVFFRDATAMHSTTRDRQRKSGYSSGDPLAVMAAVVPSSVTQTRITQVDVELTGNFTRGQLVQRWEPYMLPYVNKDVTIALGFHKDIVYRLLYQMLRW